MTARQRPAPGGARAVATGPPINGSANGDAFRWEEWFAGASPGQRAAALALAREQGLLYLHQLPAVTGAAEHAAGPALVPLLGRLLAGKTEALPPLADEASPFSDAHLDPLQRDAVRRALNTPDVCLLQGLPGTGKSRVVVEVVVQAARRGWRVLVLAPTAAAIDVVLERLAANADVLPIRMLAPDENAAALPAWLRALTLAEQQRAFRDRAVQGARQARLHAEATCQRRQREEAVWPQLLPLAERYAAIAARLATLAQRRSEVAGAVEREAAGLPCATKGLPSGPFAAELIEMHKRTAAAQADLQAAQKLLQDKQNARGRELDEAVARLATLAPRCRAREQRRWWSPGYWTGASALRERDALQARRASADAELHALAQALAKLDTEALEIAERHKAEHADLVRGETARRLQDLAAEETALDNERQQLDRAWQPLCDPIEPAALRPAGTAPAAIEAARQRWQEQGRRDEEGCQFARQWAAYLDEAGAKLSPRLPALANVVAGPTAALGRDREWAEPAASAFDLLIVEEAESLTESELLRLATHAPRLLLVAEAHGTAATTPPPERAPRPPRGLPLAGCWPRLWQALADDLGRLPYTWQRHDDHLVCHLATVPPDDTRHLESEGLADAPEIELQILNLPRCRPVLARVRFPGHFTIHAATVFIYRELQELPIQPLGRTAWWQETPDAWILHLAPTPAPAVEVVDLGGGVRMGLVAEGRDYAGRAAHLAFARADGWDRARIAPWLETHLRWRDRDRSVYLQVPHRMDRTLADVVGPVLFPDACLGKLLESKLHAGASFEFIPVPVPRQPEWPREGAGLEQDLSTGRHGDRLPAELRGELPRRGLVNFLEAQAVVRRLERWAQAPAEIGANGNGKGAPCVLVLALYDAQAELLRRLVARSAVLRSRSFPLEIAVPGQARHRECDVLVLSLTRSHAHRCVPFGEDAADLALALTRPRRRLVVFGDPGTLAKRVHWQGPLDHLDASTAHVEGVRIERLLRHAQPAAAPAR